MAKCELTNKAVADLNGIWEYTIENWSEGQADKHYICFWIFVKK
jgi:toxin ParE1/3/4